MFISILNRFRECKCEGNGFFVGRFSRGDFKSVMTINTIIFIVIAVVLFKERVFLVEETIFVFRALLTRVRVLLEKSDVMLVLSGNLFQCFLVESIVLSTVVVLTLNARTALKISVIHSVSTRANGMSLAAQCACGWNVRWRTTLSVISVLIGTVASGSSRR